MSDTKAARTNPAKILVVDDEQTLTLTLAVILRDQGYEVATAFSGEEAVTKAASFLPDLLLTDICMDAMNGVEAATQITAKLPGCKVLFISGHSTISDLANNKNTGLEFEFAPKPLHPVELVKLLAQTLSDAITVDGPVVLAVKGDAIERYAIKKILAKAGFAVQEAGTGAEALAAVHGLDAVLLDVSLPDIPGFEVHRTMKSDPETARIPVIYLAPASYSVDEAKREALALGAADVLTQPVDPNSLVAALRNALKNNGPGNSMTASVS